MPENLKWWLGEYQKQIEWARANGYSTTSAHNPKTADIVVAPLLGDLAWDQGEPYNELCPEVGKVHCITGCVATAMAQIMYYNKWPLKGTGKHSYMWNGTKLEADYSKSVYEYGKMRTTYDKNWTQSEALAVAQLMYDCGVSVDMQYGTGSSGAYSEDVPIAMKKYFDYNLSMEYLYREDYKKEEWDSIIMAELDASRVVYYSGVGGNSGHAFVCDGYKDNGYFHFNFGWSGSPHGYFATSAISPGSSKYNDYQDILIGIEPNVKHKVGDLYFSVTGDNTVILSPSYDVTEYSGNVTIPSTVNIEGHNYPVTEISAFAFVGSDVSSISIPASVTTIGTNAFSECKNLKSLTVAWTALDNIVIDKDIFDFDDIEGIELHVPEGTIGTYAQENPWFYFSKITDAAGQSIEYTAWKPFSTGTGTYTYNA